MEIIKNKDHVLFKNNLGEYHLSLDEFENLGKEASVVKATEEINKKNKAGSYQNKTINFDQARALGFCEYGVKDFCKRLSLDITKEYTIKELFESLDAETFMEYPNECLKLFTSKVFDKFDGVSGFLDNNRTRRALDLVINNADIEDNIIHTLAYKSALRVIDNFEKVYPEDDRPRKAIEAKKLFIEGKITKEELSAAGSAAWSAARSAAESAARSAAESAAWSAAGSAAWSAESAAESAESAAESAAWSAAGSAAWSAAWSAWSAAESAELDFQINTLIELIGENNGNN